VVNLFPFLMSLEDSDQPIEGAWHRISWNHVGQSSRAPTVERRQQDILGSLYGNRLFWP
jgi:hypothetical protein